MAYVLGLIYTDGNLHIRKTKSGYETGTLTFAQKEKELVEKLLHLMDCNAKIRFKEKREFENTTAGELYYFSIGNNDLSDDLTRLGVTQNKSLKMMFPKIPDEHLRHFIRGIFDGDGSVYLDKRTKAITHFLSYYAQNLPNKMFLYELKRNIGFTFKEFDNMVNSTCKYFKELGLRRGDILTCYTENSLEFCLLLCASIRYGTIFFPFPFLFIPLEMFRDTHILKPSAFFID